jgi:hypothetical protein
MGICPLPLTTLTVLMLTTEFFDFLARSAKDAGTPEGEPALCAGDIGISPGIADNPKTVTKQITTHPIKAAFVSILLFLDIWNPFPFLCP